MRTSVFLKNIVRGRTYLLFLINFDNRKAV